MQPTLTRAKQQQLKTLLYSGMGSQMGECRWKAVTDWRSKRGRGITYCRCYHHKWERLQINIIDTPDRRLQTKSNARCDASGGSQCSLGRGSAAHPKQFGDKKSGKKYRGSWSSTKDGWAKTYTIYGQIRDRREQRRNHPKPIVARKLPGIVTSANEAYIYNKQRHGYREVEIPMSKGSSLEYSTKLIESVAETTTPSLKIPPRRRVNEAEIVRFAYRHDLGRIVPMLCGFSFKNKGFSCCGCSDRYCRRPGSSPNSRLPNGDTAERFAPTARPCQPGSQNRMPHAD